MNLYHFGLKMEKICTIKMESLIEMYRKNDEGNLYINRELGAVFYRTAPKIKIPKLSL